MSFLRDPFSLQSIVIVFMYHYFILLRESPLVININQLIKFFKITPSQVVS